VAHTSANPLNLPDLLQEDLNKLFIQTLTWSRGREEYFFSHYTTDEEKEEAAEICKTQGFKAAVDHVAKIWGKHSLRTLICLAEDNSLVSSIQAKNLRRRLEEAGI